MICPKCKNPIEDSATVCEWCGVVLQTKTEKETVFCPKCKNSVKEKSATCEWCGYKMRIETENDNDDGIASWSEIGKAIIIVLFIGLIIIAIITITINK